MTKEEILARNQKYAKVLLGAEYNSRGKCVNVTLDGVRESFPQWNFAACKYELYEPEFVLQLPETYTPEEWDNLTNRQRIECNLLLGGKIKYEKGGYATNLEQYQNGVWREDRNFSNVSTHQHRIKPKPEFILQLPELYTPEEWAALTDEQRKACNELIEKDIK